LSKTRVVTEGQLDILGECQEIPECEDVLEPEDMPKDGMGFILRLLQKQKRRLGVGGQEISSTNLYGIVHKIINSRGYNWKKLENIALSPKLLCEMLEEVGWPDWFHQVAWLHEGRGLGTIQEHPCYGRLDISLKNTHHLDLSKYEWLG
jgi:hypothetical protein